MAKLKRSRWRILLYPVIGIVVLDLVYQLVVFWRQAGTIAQARPLYLLLAVLNQLMIYVALVPAMQDFYAAAHIKLSGKRVFSLLATGLAFARIVPAGEYLVWRSSVRKFPQGASASTQWLIMYYTWMLSALAVVFLVAEGLVFWLYADAHAKTLVGSLRFLPLLVSVVFLVGLLATRFAAVRRLLRRAAYDKLGSQAVSPLGIIRDRALGWDALGSLTLAAFAVWVIEAFTLFLCLRAVGLQVPFLLAVLGFAFARLFSMLPITPGGIGQIEAGTALFFAAYSFALGPVFTATILYRMITYWPALLVGGAVYAATGRRAEDRVKLDYPLVASRVHKRGL